MEEDKQRQRFCLAPVEEEPVEDILVDVKTDEEVLVDAEADGEGAGKMRGIPGSCMLKVVVSRYLSENLKLEF